MAIRPVKCPTEVEIWNDRPSYTSTRSWLCDLMPLTQEIAQSSIHTYFAFGITCLGSTCIHSSNYATLLPLKYIPLPHLPWLSDIPQIISVIYIFSISGPSHIAPWHTNILHTSPFNDSVIKYPVKELRYTAFRKVLNFYLCPRCCIIKL
jgi:hypothetical protein